MEWYWWLAILCGLGLILFFVVGVLDLFSRNPDFEIDETEEASGVINVKQNIKNDKCSTDYVNSSLRDDFDREC